MTGSVLRNALIFGASSATVVLVGAKLFLRRPLSTHWLSRLQVFAAGALFAILAIELMPDLIIAHHFAALMAFLFGVALLLALKWFTVKMNQASQGYTKTVRIIVSEAFFYMFMVGLLIGSGFAVGVREGLLLALALTAAALAICLGSLDHLQRVVATPPRVTFFVLGLGLFLLSGVVSSIVLLTTQSLIDLDLLYAFSLAVFLLWVLETFIETRKMSHRSTRSSFFSSEQSCSCFWRAGLGVRIPIILAALQP